MEIQNIIGLCISGVLVVIGLLGLLFHKSPYKKRIKEWSKYPKATATIKGSVPCHDEKGKYKGEIYTADLYVDGEQIDAIHCGELKKELLLRKGDEIKVYYRPCSFSDTVINTMDKMRESFEAITGRDFKTEAPKYEFTFKDYHLYRNEEKNITTVLFGIILLLSIIIAILSFVI